jgi:hypothetical protein
MPDDAGHDLEDHEPDNQQECDGQVASIGIGTEAMRMASAARVFVFVPAVVVITGDVLRAVLSGHQKLDPQSILVRGGDDRSTSRSAASARRDGGTRDCPIAGRGHRDEQEREAPVERRSPVAASHFTHRNGTSRQG